MPTMTSENLVREYEKAKENFMKELDFVIADVVALGGASYSLLQRIGAIAQNGAKLFAVGTTASMVGHPFLFL
ncbi:hypothetical protein IFM89_012150 [Coptis chinensis]|uniref:Uncharacterized protein n=1 Tax=Coptis chinensis TaxID=261450 RepID=A0A835I2U1_9MAGN|nr:hypothetical protein IFM89_012150 [Coptis chinensis]